MKAEPFLLALLLNIVSIAPQVRAQETISDSDAWGEVSGGLQLRIATGKNTELLTETRSMLFLEMHIRNVSDAAASVNLDQATYNFEYEFDGTWYAFDPETPVRTAILALNADPAMRNLVQAIDPGTGKTTILTLPLAGRSPALQLRAITGNAPGKRFEPKQGPHVVRVRPGSALFADQQAPVSNAVTVAFRNPPLIEIRSQSISFASSRGTSLRAMRFVSGPADGQAVIREVLSRPPQPSSLPELISAAALQVVDPLPYYDLMLPRRAGAGAPSLPTSTTLHHYIVRSGNQVVATIGLATTQGGSVLNWVGTAAGSEPVFRALQELGTLSQVQGGDYEPRLLRVTGARGASPILLFWLRSSTGRPDLFYRPRDPEFRGRTKIENSRIYNTEEMIKAARTMPVAPRHDEAWAIDAASTCAKSAPTDYAEPLFPARAEVEIGLNDTQDRIVWYVFIPGQMPPRRVMNPQPGAAFLVDEADGSCTTVMRE